MVELFDAVIVGGGPGGLSCALELHDSKLNYVLLERQWQFGSQLSNIRNTIRNFAGGFYENGEELRVKLQDLSERLDIRCVLGANVETVDLEKRTVFANGTQFVGRTLVLATGYRTRRLHLPGESMFSNDIYYYTEGQEEHFYDKNIAVIGGGDSALMECMILSERCPKIFLIHRSRDFRARPDVIEAVRSNPRINFYLDTEIDSLSGTKQLKGIQVITRDNGQVLDLPVEKMIVKVGYAPNTELFRDQVDMDASGHIAINEFCETSARKVFAVGDITRPGYPRIATAMGHGMIAAARIRSIIEERQQ